MSRSIVSNSRLPARRFLFVGGLIWPLLAIVSVFPRNTASAGNLTTKAGITYQDVRVLGAQADRLRIMHAHGVTSIAYEDLPADVAHRYGMDSAAAAAARERKVSGAEPAAAPPSKAAAGAAEQNQASAAEIHLSQVLAALRALDLSSAHRSLTALSQALPHDSLTAQVAETIRLLQISVNGLRGSQQSLAQARAEAQRLTRSAAVTGRVNVLDPNDKSGENRAAVMLREAKQLEDQANASVKAAIVQITTSLQTIDGLARKEEKLGNFSMALAIVSFVEAFGPKIVGAAAIKSDITPADQNELQQRVATAASRIVAAKAKISARKVWSASKDVDAGLKAEPGNLSLQRLDGWCRERMGTVAKAAAEAARLKNSKSYEAALEKVKGIDAMCVDDPEANHLQQDLEQIIAEKAERLARAQTDEAAGDLESAVAVYDMYAVNDSVQRLLPKLAKQYEDGGNFLGAYSLYQRANAAVDMERVKNLKDRQADDYEKAKTLLADAKFADAAAIFERYKDKRAQRDVLLRRAAHAESKEQFDEAIQLYVEANAAADVERLRVFKAGREKLRSDGKNLERAANLEAALDLFTRAGSQEDVRRVALTLARTSEQKKEYESAASYYETAGAFEEAARIRRDHDVIAAVATRPLRDEEVFKRCSPACVTVESTHGEQTYLGSGFFVAKGGYILTNNHVVEGASSIQVRLKGGATVVAKVLRSSELPDLALLKAETSNHPILALADSDKVETAAHASAIGSPKGFELSFTAGNISAVDREFRGNKCFQVSVLINHGNSGGPLLNEYGQVIGVNTFGQGTAAVVDGVSIGSDVQGINFAVKINEAKRLLGDLAVIR